MLASTVSVQLRSYDFKDISHQGKLKEATSSTKQIYKKAKELLEEMYIKGSKVRLIGVRVDNLIDEDILQISMFHNEEKEKSEQIIRKK